MSKQQKSGFIALALFFFIFLGLVGLLYYAQINTTTGRAIINLETNYLPNETLQGTLSLSLKEGELIPKDTIVRVTMNGVDHDYNLSDLVSNSQESNGNFYAEDLNLSGNGQGYGVEGTKVTYPEVSFVMRVVSSSDSVDENPDNENNDSDVEEDNSSNESEIVEEAVDEVPVEELEETPEEVIEENAGGNLITGNVVAEFSQEIEGTVTGDEPYTYELNEGETVEIVSSDQDVELNIEGNIVTITTDYSIEEQGYGEDYLSEEASYELDINLSEIQLLAEEGELTVAFIYSDETIVSASTELDIDNPNQISSNTSSVNVTIISENIEDYDLNEQELFALQGKTGKSVVEITQSEVINDRLIIKFELGNYWLETSYAYDGSDLTEQIELDRAKWLKRLAQSFLDSSSSSSEELDEYMGEYNFASNEDNVEEESVTNESENNDTEEINVSE